MADRAEHLPPIEAAAEAVKAYLRMHRDKIVEDSELLSLLLPPRFSRSAGISDFQRFLIEKLSAENVQLKAERDGLRRVSDRAGLTREGVRRLVLELIEARNFEQAIQVATNAAEALDVNCAALGVESEASSRLAVKGVCLLAPGLADSLVERDAVGALIKGGAHPKLFVEPTDNLQSVAVFRLRIGPKTPPALFAVGSSDPERFDDDGETREIAYFVHALERTIRAWLDLPKS